MRSGPPATRSASRMLVLDGAAGSLRDLQFRDFPSLLNPADLLVFNDTRVIPARVFGLKESGGRVEILLERALTANTALVHLRASKGLKPGAVGQAAPAATRRACSDGRAICSTCSSPAKWRRSSRPTAKYRCLPTSTARPESADRERYQTVYARILGRRRGAHGGPAFRCGYFCGASERAGSGHAFVTLHVGAGTFQPVRVDDIEGHEMHEEYLEVPEAACDAIEATRAAGGRVIAVGTTVVRSLETAAAAAAHGARRGRRGRGRAPAPSRRIAEPREFSSSRATGFARWMPWSPIFTCRSRRC